MISRPATEVLVNVLRLFAVPMETLEDWPTATESADLEKDWEMTLENALCDSPYVVHSDWRFDAYNVVTQLAEIAERCGKPLRLDSNDDAETPEILVEIADGDVWEWSAAEVENWTLSGLVAAFGELLQPGLEIRRLSRFDGDYCDAYAFALLPARTWVSVRDLLGHDFDRIFCSDPAAGKFHRVLDER